MREEATPNTIPVRIERVKCEVNASTALPCPRRVYAVIYDLFVALQLAGTSGLPS